MSTQQMRSQQTKEKIYQAAKELLIGNEFKNITIQEICACAGISIGSFYHHFPFKEALLTEIYRRSDEYFKKIVINRIPEGHTFDRLCTFFRLWVHFIMTSIGITNIRNPDKQWQLFHQQMLSLDTITTSTLRQIIETGILKSEVISTNNTNQFIEFIKSYLWGFSYRWCFQKGHIENKPTFDTFTDTLAAMLKPINEELQDEESLYFLDN